MLQFKLRISSSVLQDYYKTLSLSLAVPSCKEYSPIFVSVYTTTDLFIYYNTKGKTNLRKCSRRFRKVGGIHMRQYKNVGVARHTRLPAYTVTQVSSVRAVSSASELMLSPSVLMVTEYTKCPAPSTEHSVNNKASKCVMWLWFVCRKYLWYNISTWKLSQYLQLTKPLNHNCEFV